MIPRLATYRLQFRQGMDFDRAVQLVPYLKALGVSHLYASPIFVAAPESTHGYDVADFNAVDPALGGEAGLLRLAAALRAHGLGLILDFVPNHMAATPHNPWWRDVLEWGDKSRRASHFDIDWTTPKLIVPALGDAYGRVLAKGELTLRFDDADGGMSMAYHDLRLPLTPPSYAQVLAAAGLDGLTDLANRFAVANPETAPALKEELAGISRERRVRSRIARAADGLAEDRDRLHALHESQVWQLRHWRAARETLTYRRFFEIADLVGVRMEQPSVFEDCHRLVLRLVADGHVDGLRLDHVDGLADPKSYLTHLQSALGGEDSFLVLVEKILEPSERLRAEWPVAGTTGYEFIGALADLLTDPDGRADLSAAYETFIGEPAAYPSLVFENKRRIFARNLAGELDVLTRLALELAAADLDTRDFGPDTLRRAIIEIATALPVYRTYVDVEGARPEDRALIERAAEQAKHTREVEDETAIDFVARLLLLDIADPERRGEALDFATRFQQTTGPLMAKAVEDTLFYRYNRLIALNEVGGDPDRFGASLEQFHQAMTERRQRQPLGLSATATHDTKRGEDARARLYAISEAPHDWAAAATRWRALNEGAVRNVASGRAPTANDEWLFYQSLLGAWPAELPPEDGAGLGALAERMAAYMVKAAREAKVRTSWTATDAEYEEALRAFVRAALDPARSAAFLADFADAIRPLLAAGLINSLGQSLIKLTAPGLPDIYQGTEFWDLSLVDPDNRRPVDFAAREASLAAAAPVALLPAWRDGRVKLALIRAVLGVRRERHALFADGGYLPLILEGPAAGRLLAFARTHESGAALVVVPRRPLHLLDDQDSPAIAASRLGDTVIRLPGTVPCGRWRDPLAERSHEATGGRLAAGALLDRFPVGLLLSMD